MAWRVVCSVQCAVCGVWCLVSVRQVAVCSVQCAVPRECATGGGRVTVPAGDLDIAPTRSHKARIAVHRLKYAAPPHNFSQFKEVAAFPIDVQKHI